MVHWHPCTRRPELDVGPPSAPGRAWGRMKCRHKPSVLQTHHELFPAHTGVVRCCGALHNRTAPAGEHHNKKGL